ncbi:hypothetical protein IV102_28775 [bacterium]|nr:hypothetical protein [bacterium]
MCARPKGITLIELLVTVGLVLVLLVAGMWLFLPTLNALSRGTARSEVEEQAVLSLYKVEEELRRSAPEGIQVFSQAEVTAARFPGLLVTPLKDVDGDGDRVWWPKVLAIWWDRPGQRLSLKSWPPKNPAGFAMEPTVNRPACLNLNEYVSLVESLNGTEISWAKGVTQFDVTDSGVADWAVPPISLTITVRRQEGHHMESFQARRTLTLRTQ